MRQNLDENRRLRPPVAQTQPNYDTPDYRSSSLRAPRQPLLPFPYGRTEATGPRFSQARFPPITDLSCRNGADAQGQRIIVAGSVTDEDGRPVPEVMIELWQANAAGRYRHAVDQHDAPLDPAFDGSGRVFTNEVGNYRFVSIRPGSYPWRNHANAWRPSHIHFSLFGPSFAQRLITQMYFEGDPLLGLDPIFNSVPDRAARERLVARFDISLTEPEWAHGYRFEIVLRGRDVTPMEN